MPTQSSHVAQCSNTCWSGNKGPRIWPVQFKLQYAAFYPTWPFSSALISHAGHWRVIQQTSLHVLLAKHTVSKLKKTQFSCSTSLLQNHHWTFSAWDKVFYLQPFIPLQKFQHSAAARWYGFKDPPREMLATLCMKTTITHSSITKQHFFIVSRLTTVVVKVTMNEFNVSQLQTEKPLHWQDLP